MKKLRFFDSLKFVRFVVAVIAATLILNIAHAATLPAGYTELEYLESTGTQWIDTGYILQSNDVTYEWTAEDLSTATTTSLFGSEQTGNPKYSGILYGNKARRTLFVGNDSYTVTYSSDSGFHDWVLSLTNDHNATLYKDGTLISNVSFSGNLQKSISIGVFNNHKSTGTSNQYAKMMLKKFVIKDNNAVAVNLIPARRDSDGVLGMYDLADANPATAFHTNVGTGEFVAGSAVPIKIATTRYNEEQFAPVQNELSNAMNVVDDVVSRTMTQAQAIDQIANEKQTRPDEGCTAKYCLLVEDEGGTPHWYPIAGANGVAHNLPAGYTELQYIESDGASWIDTGIAPTATTLQIDYKMQILQKAYVSLFGAVAGTTPRNGFRIYYQPSDNTNSLTFQAGAATVNQAFTWNDVLEGSVVVKQGTSIVSTINGNTINQATGANLTQSATILVGTSHVGSGVSGLTPMKIWSFKITKNGAVVFNGVPAKNANDEIGMYDLADPNPATAFHTNAGTGEFTAGPNM